MSRITFKRSILASAVLLATQTANAALYQVMEVTPSTGQSYGSAWGVAIQASNPDTIANCFTSSSIDIGSPSTGTIACTDFALAGETRIEKASTGKAVDGLSYRDEVAFGIDNAFVYVQERNDFERYCYSELLYSTCNTWADPHWNRWQAEINSTQVANSIAFIGTGTTGAPIDESQNVIVNSLTSNATPIGINVKTGDVTTYRRNNNTIQARSTVAPTVTDALYTRAWKTDGVYTVGSISRSSNNNEGAYFYSKPAIWKKDGSTTTTVELNWPSTRESTNNRLAQGSIRDVLIRDNKIYAVGYSSFDADNNYMQASVFELDNTSNFSNAASWTTKAVSGAESRIGGDYIHSNSVVTDVNKNLVALGSAKRAGSRPENGAAGNRLFVIEDVSASTPTANFLTGGIFFTGAGGKAGAINSYNEIVGQVDANDTRENDGKPRRKRGFIYPYSANGSDPSRMAIFANKAWLLDDLTNDNTATGNNNQFRIIDATDINDAGVISATALKCSGGYDTTAHNSLCSNREETVVAVKLVPIVNATSANIQQRSTEEQASERKGGSFGLGLLMVLGVLGFRRK
ncbi:DUF3466 family protein [Vibrio cholerae]|uniref:DUF3466 family protein n=2 Tax=Vibrio cholerae TaxID=666 RepID=A0A7Z7VMM3_VIBCL|nr:DUF3466 family protein [Vibrio cholerae]GHW83558.1 GlyGly-CTERM domain protein [Vibrio metoecus]EGQ8579530.1 DUF3466 family protein [Vibrio cholerae]EGR0010654.1 DUF3466 family protein [Vibrio cholerae]EGR0524265.1 DUF3466 family protein [Vibrio cholerae]EGR0600022.1 DUF3466 family protein [Vibrio cholerae]